MCVHIYEGKEYKEEKRETKSTVMTQLSPEIIKTSLLTFKEDWNKGLS